MHTRCILEAFTAVLSCPHQNWTNIYDLSDLANTCWAGLCPNVDLIVFLWAFSHKKLHLSLLTGPCSFLASVTKPQRMLNKHNPKHFQLWKRSKRRVPPFPREPCNCKSNTNNNNLLTFFPYMGAKRPSGCPHPGQLPFQKQRRSPWWGAGSSCQRRGIFPPVRWPPACSCWCLSCQTQHCIPEHDVRKNNSHSLYHMAWLHHKPLCAEMDVMTPGWFIYV